MLAVIIFMMLVYRESLKESCLSYEKLVKDYKVFRYILQIKGKGVV